MVVLRTRTSTVLWRTCYITDVLGIGLIVKALLHWRIRNTFLLNALPYPKKNTVLFEVFQILPACPSDMGSIVISIHGMKDTDKEISEESLTHCQFDNHKSLFQTFAVFCMLYVSFWVILRRLNFICRRFGTLCLFHLHRQVGVEWLNFRATLSPIWIPQQFSNLVILHLTAYEDGTDRFFRNVSI